MGFFSPEIPANAKQTNCWKCSLILGTILYTASILSIIISGIVNDYPGLFDSLLSEVVSIIIFFVEMQHQAYVLIEVNDEDINVRMGPCEWPLIRWFCSSQIRKSEIISVERKERQCCYDICPRFYCYPINWCCCHKSYSAYYWPFCCNDFSWFGCCDGDSDSSVMVQFNLTEGATDFSNMCCKRCAPCPLPFSFCWCCVYNRIAVAVQSESILTDLKNKGYPLSVNATASEQTALVNNPQTTQPGV